MARPLPCMMQRGLDTRHPDPDLIISVEGFVFHKIAEEWMPGGAFRAGLAAGPRRVVHPSVAPGPGPVRVRFW